MLVYDCSIGWVPSELCGMASLTDVQITNTGNSGLVCAYNCLSTKAAKTIPSEVCPTAQDTALCSLVAATNAESLDTKWACTTLGAHIIDPCVIGWSGVYCTGDVIVSVNAPSFGVTGMCAIASIVIHSY